MSVERVNVRDMIDFLILARKGRIIRGQEIYHGGQWSYEFKKRGGFFAHSTDETVIFGEKDGLAIHYHGHVMPEFMPGEFGEDNAVLLARKVNNFLDQCCLRVEPSRPFRGPEEANIKIPGFSELQYAARADLECLNKEGKVNLDHFRGTDFVVINRDGFLSTLWEGSYLGGRFRLR